MTKKMQVVPTKRQLQFQAWEFGLFIHFGLRTFYEGYVDFDERPMSPEKFNPTHLDCNQWMKTAKEAGMKYAVMTAKHHDGFSNWPSAYTDFSVRNSAWKNGKGDVVEEFIQACRANGIKPGLYYSPYDGSAEFYDQKDGKAYDDYFVNQITELLTNYGEIDVLWFDGAGSEGHEYDWQRIVQVIRTLQPNILIFNMADPNFRWIGNEDGLAPLPNWNTVDALEVSIYEEKKEELEESIWLPAECDVRMRDHWFYSDHDEHTVKALEELIGMYYLSVGRGTNFLLNIGPNREGLLPEKDRIRLLELGDEIRRRSSNPLATIKDYEQSGQKWIYKTEDPYLIDHIIIQENLSQGEKVKAFTISIITASSGQVLPIYKGENIGHKAIVKLPAVRMKGIIVEVTSSGQDPIIKEITHHFIGECT